MLMCPARFTCCLTGEVGLLVYVSSNAVNILICYEPSGLINVLLSPFTTSYSCHDRGYGNLDRKCQRENTKAVSMH
jgi:hypothetical protein